MPVSFRARSRRSASRFSVVRMQTRLRDRCSESTASARYTSPSFCFPFSLIRDGCHGGVAGHAASRGAAVARPRRPAPPGAVGGVAVGGRVAAAGVVAGARGGGGGGGARRGGPRPGGPGGGGKVHTYCPHTFARPAH